MTSILLGFVVIAAGFILAQLFRRWSKADADGLKKMADREKAPSTRKASVPDSSGVRANRGKRHSAPDFGRR